MALPPAPPQSIANLAAYLGAFTNYELSGALPADRRELGPERARGLLARLDLLPPRVPVVQVAGSKGKGSTVLWMERLLAARGRRPGAYLSPHLEHPRERIRASGKDASDADLLEGLAAIHPHVAEIEAAAPREMPTFFDLWTALALWIFRRRGCDHVLLEVGLGGPLDSTTAVPHTAAVLTTIDLEHRRELGDTLEAIAREKARIARPGCAFVLAESGTPWAEAARTQAAAQGARVIFARRARAPALLAPPQDSNLAAAVAALESLPEIGRFSEAELTAAAAAPPFPARLELLPGPPPLLLDAAHTPRSFAHFWERFESLRRGSAAALLIAFLRGKEWERALQAPAVASRGALWIVTRADAARGVEPEAIADYLRARGAEALVIEDPAAAIEYLRARGLEGTAVAASGSFYLAAKARSRWLSAKD
ncbi:MAG: hypothetical protein L0Z55_00930 [Planctomycetes bacterium]|nr:hypothetical protein [Planctomycetota bacterium]